MARLSPIDLMFLSGTEQAVVNYLNRHPHSTLVDLVESTRVPADELETVIQQMLSAAQLVEQYEDGKRTFSVQYRCDRSRTRSRSASLLDLFE